MTALARTLMLQGSSKDDSSDVSDLDKFEEAHADFGALTAGVDPRTLERDCSGHERNVPTQLGP